MNTTEIQFIIPKETLYDIYTYVYDIYPDNEIICNMYLESHQNHLHLYIDKSSLHTGTEDNVSYNNNNVYIDMHTHPVKAYKMYNTSIGFPSTADFHTIVYSILEEKSIFHVLGSMEGIYIISLHEDIAYELHAIWDSYDTNQKDILFNQLKNYIDQHITYSKQNFENGQYIKGHYVNSGQSYQEYVNTRCSKGSKCIQLGDQMNNLFRIQFYLWISNTNFDTLSEETQYYKHLKLNNFKNVNAFIHLLH